MNKKCAEGHRLPENSKKCKYCLNSYRSERINRMRSQMEDIAEELGNKILETANEKVDQFGRAVAQRTMSSGSFIVDIKIKRVI